MSAPTDRPVALVTGGRQGIGRACALALARQGFDLVLVDLHDDERARVTLAELRALGAQADLRTADIADLTGHATLVTDVFALHGRVDCLVDNAGVAARPLKDVLDITPADFDHNFDLNIRGTFFLTQAVARRMLEDPAPRPYRSVIVISSMAAHYARLNRSQYCMSKAAVAMMAKVMALRLAPHGIHVHDVRPGFIRTEMTGSLDTGPQDARIASGEVPLRRWGEAEDVGRLVATLAAGLVPYVTGEPFVIDGGLRANSA
ncbi:MULTISPECIES: 3-ketoacyl-ACP reductase [unclassified Variovorax]|uniref:3-ketoacyl-ACP reductase n=1 Tax=unclassified Variovorax TaxID=663243 RepID=UPI002576BAD5|nr:MULTISPECIES: 3-ketoacyl-ACP reductase [unclassified Variovorax]MDM0088216.1 3-ketoacyl-ACP reductase [Variovorax sp. J22G40]MDM0146289.1 3-ketoacyl-ACP reductase [Variovorax sp. J2P1-31]